MSLPLVTRYGANPLLDLEVANKQYVDSSGGQTFSRVVKLVDESRPNDSTLSDDSELSIAVEANATYFGIVMLQVATDITADFKYNFNIPAGASGRRNSSPAWQAHALGITVAVDAGGTNVAGSIGTDTLIVYFNVRVVGAGVVALEWAQQTSNAFSTTVQQGSFMVMWKSL